MRSLSRGNLQGGKILENFDSIINCIILTITTAQGGEAVSRRAHNPQIVGSNPTPANFKTIRLYKRRGSSGG